MNSKLGKTGSAEVIEKSIWDQLIQTDPNIRAELFWEGKKKLGCADQSVVFKM